MFKDAIKAAMKEALAEYLATDAGRKAVGQACYDAVNAAMAAEVRMVDGKSEPGRRVEKTETVNLIHFLARYLPGVEAAIRGCQADAAGARNRALDNLAATERVVAALTEMSTHRQAIAVEELATIQIEG